jgi:hypothetical protein
VKKFRYYITDLYDGSIKGSNNQTTAEDFATCEDYFVVNTETNEWLRPQGPVEIQEFMEAEEESGG